MLALKKQQKLINSHPKQAKKDILKDEIAPSRSSLKALNDPDTNTRLCTQMATEPGKVAQAMKKYYTYALKSINTKTGKYLPEAALRVRSESDATPENKQMIRNTPQILSPYSLP